MEHRLCSLTFVALRFYLDHHRTLRRTIGERGIEVAAESGDGAVELGDGPGLRCGQGGQRSAKVVVGILQLFQCGLCDRDMEDG